MVKKGVCSSVTKNLRESRKITGKQTACLDHTDRCALLCVDRACVCPSDRRRSHFLIRFHYLRIKMILHIKYKRQSRHLVPEGIFMM